MIKTLIEEIYIKVLKDGNKIEYLGDGEFRLTNYDTWFYKVMVNIRYRDGNLISRTQGEFKNGQTAFISHSKDTFMDGWATNWDPDGRKFRDDMFCNGKLIIRRRYYK